MIYELKGEDGALIQVVSKGIDMDYVFHPLRIYLCTLLAFFFFYHVWIDKESKRTLILSIDNTEHRPSKGFVFLCLKLRKPQMQAPNDSEWYMRIYY